MNILALVGAATLFYLYTQYKGAPPPGQIKPGGPIPLTGSNAPWSTLFDPAAGILSQVSTMVPSWFGSSPIIPAMSDPNPDVYTPMKPRMYGPPPDPSYIYPTPMPVGIPVRMPNNVTWAQTPETMYPRRFSPIVRRLTRQPRLQISPAYKAQLWDQYNTERSASYQQDILNAFQASGAPPTLSYGNQGDAVVMLQTSLAALGYDTVTSGGLFDDDTLAALVAFQHDNGISEDGVAHSDTWNLLLAPQVMMQ